MIYHEPGFISTYVCRESRSELLELSKVRANVDVAIL